MNLDTKSIGKLTIAVWVLSALVCIDISLSLFRLFFPFYLAKSVQASLCKPALLPNAVISEDQYKGFYEWPIEKQVQEASVIVIARYEKENEKLKCVISEILKQTPGTTFYYKIGDEYRPCSRYLQDDVACGEGQIIFFTDSPASMRFSCSFDGNRIGGLGNMPFETLREVIHKTKLNTEPGDTPIPPSPAAQGVGGR